MGMIRAGRLNRRVTFLRAEAVVNDGLDSGPGALASIGRRSASLKPARGREQFEHLGKEAFAVMTLWVRRDSLTRNLTAADAALVDGITYQIVAPPMEVGNREGIEIYMIADDTLTVAAGAGGSLDFSDPANSGLLTLLAFTAISGGAGGQMDFSDADNSGLLALT